VRNLLSQYAINTYVIPNARKARVRNLLFQNAVTPNMLAKRPRRTASIPYQAGLPSWVRKIKVSPPKTISRASIRSAPSCLTFEPVI
jgi:hypothetical protein